jgi:branched-chain amino acid aminotransferase
MSSSRPPRVFVNVHGEILPAEEAKVSALDHGFLYGDSVYETIRTYDRTPFLLEPHLDRLERSAARIRLRLPAPRRAIASEIERTIASVPIDSDVAVRVVLSRGAGPIGLDIEPCHEPHCVIYVMELVPGAVSDLSQPSAADGGIAVVISAVRRNHPRALDPAIKSGNYLNNVLAYFDAKDAGAVEAILLSAEGFLAEGTTSNVHIVRGGRVETPKSHGILDGITRSVVLEEAARHGVEVVELDLPPQALYAADEAFISSSIRGILPIATVDGRKVASGVRGPLTRRLQELYQARVLRECGARRTCQGAL